MRGVFCDGSTIRYRADLPEPVPGPDEVVVGVLKVGICDTDVQLARGYMGFRGLLGHEFVGMTPDGRRVTGEINNACHACATCRAGMTQHCPHRSVLGILNHDGAMAERVAIPARNLHPIPAAIGDDEAVFVEPLAAAFRITEQVAIAPATRVAVVGDGKLGLLSAWVLRLAGGRVTLVGKHPAKLALAGPEIATCPLAEAERLARSQDVVVDCTGAPSGLATALGLVRPLGTVVLKTTVAGHHDLSLAPIVIDEVRLIGSRCGPFPPAIAALAARQIDVRPLIQEIFPLDQAEAAFEAATGRGARKIILDVRPKS